MVPIPDQTDIEAAHIHGIDEEGGPYSIDDGSSHSFNNESQPSSLSTHMNSGSSSKRRDFARTTIPQIAKNENRAVALSRLLLINVLFFFTVGVAGAVFGAAVTVWALGVVTLAGAFGAAGALGAAEVAALGIELILGSLNLLSEAVSVRIVFCLLYVNLFMCSIVVCDVYNGAR